MNPENSPNIPSSTSRLSALKKWLLTFYFWNKDRDIKILKLIIFLIFLIGLIWFIVDISVSESGDEYASESEEEENCNITAMELRGDLVTYIPANNFDEQGNLLYDETASEYIQSIIDDANNNEKIKAIILEVDSYGGLPVAAEEISNALKNSEKYSVAIIRGAGVSAAYWASTGADRIFASKNSDVGGIGVTMSYLDNVRQNQENGLNYNNLSSGKFKETGNPDKQLTIEEKELLMRDINIIHNNFIQAVAKNRNLDVKKVESLADGSSLLGEAALANGLIDEIGDLNDVSNHLEERLGQDPEICWER